MRDSGFKERAEKAIERAARKQCGVISRSQAIAAGFSPSNISRRVRKGAWKRPLPEVYIVRDDTDRWKQMVWAASLSLGPDAVVSHRTAARLHRLGLKTTTEIEFVIPGRSCKRRPGVTIHRGTLARAHTMNLEGLRLTTIARTLADLGSVCTPKVVESALEEALRRDRTSIEELGLLLGQICGKGYRGTKTLRALIENHCGTATGSELEVEFERFCRRHRLPKAIRQYPVHDTDGSIIGRVDFAYPDYKVAIEIEGFEYHSGRIRFDTDLDRYNRLVAITWHPLRLTKMHLAKEGLASAQKIKKLLRA